MSKLFVISAPSGGGKTTIVKSILERHPEFSFSVSATTRQKRAVEVEGKDYFFLSREEFERLLREDALVEHEVIYGNYYGTLKREVNRVLDRKGNMLFDIDVRGGLSIRRVYPKEAVLIFVEPPSIDVLRERLRNRKTEDEETFQRRMDRVAMELERGKEFDYRVVNDKLDVAIEEVQAIVTKHLSAK